MAPHEHEENGRDMSGRVETILTGRRERMERAVGRTLEAVSVGADIELTEHQRDYLMSEAKDLYWNELEWERITDEEALEQGPLVELTFPGFLAYVRGLLLTEVMPDSLSPPNPRPQIVGELLDFLAGRVVELEEGLDSADPGEPERLRAELEMTSALIDRAMYLYFDLSDHEIELVEMAQASG